MIKVLYQPNVQQTIFDVALQHYGSVEGLSLLLSDNRSLINEQGDFDLTQLLKVQPKKAVDAFVLSEYRKKYNYYIPVTQGIDGTEYVLIDENGDYLTDDGGDAIISAIP